MRSGCLAMTTSGRNSQEETSSCMCAPRTSWLAVHAAEAVMPSTGAYRNQDAQKRGYGYRDQEFFKLRILGIYKAKYSLTG